MHQARIQQKQGIEGYGAKLSYLCIVLELQRCTLDLSGWRCQSPPRWSRFDKPLDRSRAIRPTTWTSRSLPPSPSTEESRQGRRGPSRSSKP